MQIIKGLATLLLAAFHLLALGQSKEVDIRYVVNSDNSVDFFYDKDHPGSYTVSVDFSNLTNASYSDFPRVIKGASGKLFTLKPLNIDRGIGFSYNYTYIRGKLNPKVDNSFTYLLPFGKGTKTFVQELRNLNQVLFGRKLPTEWKAYQFTTSDTDTVRAIRKGLVIEVVDEYELDTISSYTSKKNIISIEHPDGTIAEYRGFLKSEILVKPGDTVYPHTRLGLIGKPTDSHDNKLNLMIFFLTDDDIHGRARSNVYNYESMYQFITPDFYSSKGKIKLSNNNSYTVDVKTDMVTAEMTKKEIKKFGVK